METLQSSNESMFNLTDVPHHVLTRKNSTRPTGVVVRVPGHGDWNYMDPALDKKEYPGIPQLLEHTLMLQYANTTDDPESSYIELLVAKWDAQSILKQFLRCVCGQPHRLCGGVCAYTGE